MERDLHPYTYENPPLPDTICNVQRSASQKSLGPPTAVYQDRPLRWRDFFLIFLPAGAAALAPFFYGLQRFLYARVNYGPVAATTWSWPWYALSTIALIPLILLALQRVRRAHRMVILHEHGLLIRWTGGQFHNLTWDGIDGLVCDTIQTTFLGFPLKVRHRLKLLTQTGNSIHIDDRIPKLAELTERIKAKTYPRLLPKLRSAYQQGETLFFGPVTLHKNTIKLREREIPWELISRLNVVSGQLVVESKFNRKFRVPTGKIPNVDLLIQLLQEGVHP